MIINSLFEYKAKEVLVPVDEIQEGGEILLREMVGDRAASFNGLDDSEKTGINLLIASMIDESGNQIHRFEDAKAIMNAIPSAILVRLINAAFDINGFGSLETAEDVHNAKKN